VPATSNNVKLVHWPLIYKSGLLHLVLRGQPIHQRPITVLLYNGPLLCSFNASIEALVRHIVLLVYAVL